MYSAEARTPVEGVGVGVGVGEVDDGLSSVVRPRDWRRRERRLGSASSSSS